ncbi:MAG TPA: GMC family oxidoreductase [Ktedonobacteraceae bacterium]|nr:GMC family oxidoreductase [Ktedonobacteraceae bacterium]
MAVTSQPSSKASSDLAAGWLTPGEFSVLEAFIDTLLPSLEPPEGSSEEVSAYYRRSARNLDVARLVAETLGQENEDEQKKLHQLFTLLAGPMAGLMLIGSPHSFLSLSLAKREKYLSAMANSPLGQLRQGFQAIKRLAGFVYFAAPDVSGVNPNWTALDYDAPAPPPADAPQPISPLKITLDTTLDADVVVIGSGAGGGLVAGELAMAGKSVVVLEKGGYNNESNFTYLEAQATPELYLKRGTLTSKDLGVVVLAGSTLGGGTVVNWMTSFRTPEEILDEWARSSGIRDLTGPGLQASFEAVEKRLSVAEVASHNRQNQLLYDACVKMGYHAGVLRNDSIDCQQRCGFCGFGCRYGSKQSTMKTYLQDAYEHGARIVVRCSAERLLIENGKAVGVEATALDTETGKQHRVTVRAKAVVVAAGAVSTPALLVRSGLDNPHIGRHLRLHPVVTVTGIYPEKVYAWKGVMQSAYSNEFGYLDGNYGYKIEVPPAHPGLIGMSTPWFSPRDYREQMLQTANVATFILLARDKGEGRVSVDRFGEPVIDYVISVYDRQHLKHGLRQAARLHFAAGATSIVTLHNKKTRIDRPANGEVSEQQYRAYDRQVERHGMNPNRLIAFSAHQMGTCRMGADPKDAVVDGNHEVYGVKGLFVCDGSVFPSASGVNPMLSIMGLAHRASGGIKGRV